MILFSADFSGAGGATFSYVIHKAGTLPPCYGFLQILFAMPYGKLIANDGKLLLQANCGKIRPKVCSPIGMDATHHFHPGEVLSKINAHIGEMLVIL